jgi:hypothetical protein
METRDDEVKSIVRRCCICAQKLRPGCVEIRAIIIRSVRELSFFCLCPVKWQTPYTYARAILS